MSETSPVPCARCGHLNHRDAPTCPHCETMLPARHRVLRTGWLVVALPFTIIGFICLVMGLADLIEAKVRGETGLLSFLCSVLVPAGIAAIGWVNYQSHNKR